jgi:hypothetical protein
MNEKKREKKANVLMDGKSVTKEKQRNCHTRAPTSYNNNNNGNDILFF